MFSPKTLKQCHMTKICSGKRCNMYHTTVVYNVLKSNFEYLHSRWKYSHLIRVLFQVSCTLKFGSDIQSQTKVRVWKPKIAIRPPGSHFESNVAESRFLPMTTISMNMKFEIEIPKQTWLTLRKPCHLQSPETEKSNMAARRPFWKRRCWKSIGSYPYT